MPVSKKKVSECPVDAMMRVMDGRWKGTILWRLQDGPRRTSELKRSIPGITKRMLIRHLQELVADGIVKRDDKKTTPLRLLFAPVVWKDAGPSGRDDVQLGVFAREASRVTAMISGNLRGPSAVLSETRRLLKSPICGPKATFPERELCRTLYGPVIPGQSSVRNGDAGNPSLL
jgi:DNA-binding HxlR family transcriptional regulator